MTQKIHFCPSADGAGFAYLLLSQDPPLAKTANYLTCLEYDWTGLVWQHWLLGLAQRQWN